VDRRSGHREGLPVDWQSGKILSEVQMESHNISGLGVGGGYLWAGSNGGVSGRRPPRPTDQPYEELSQLDMKTGKIVKLSRPQWGRRHARGDL
jgi:hypothetical protein